MDAQYNHTPSHSDSKLRPKVILYTVLVYIFLVLLLLLNVIERSPEPTIMEDAIEINLGNVEDAFGRTPPTSIKAKNAAIRKPAVEQPIAVAQQNVSKPTESKIVETVKTNDEDIASILQQKESQIVAQPTPKEIASQPIPQESLPVEFPEPQKQPIAVFRQTGVDESVSPADLYDSYGSEAGNQGVTLGEGDMGILTGSIASDNYGSSVSVVGGLGKRKIVSSPALKSDFDKEGIVQIKVIFNREGLITSSQQDIQNSTTTQKQLVDIALEYVKKIRLNQDETSPYEQAVLFRFIFKIRL